MSLDIVIPSTPKRAPDESAAAPRIIGRYELLQPLGRGGAGDVWRARDTWTGVERALKVLRAPPAEAPDEVLLLAEVQHPGLCRLHDYVPGPTPAIAMELIEGHDLDMNGGLGLSTLAPVACDLLEALAFLHGRGWLHRDVKPANIRVTDDGRGVLLDLGLAALEGTDTLAGTPAWLAPEILAGAPQSPQSDLYALGVSLRSAADRDAQETLRGWLGRMTASDPAARTPSAFAALDELRATIDDLPAPAMLASPRLLGRDEELAAITAILRDLTRVGREGPSFVLIEGVAGSGRARLQRSVRHRAQILGLTAVDLAEGGAAPAPSDGGDPITAAELSAARVRATTRRIRSLETDDTSGLVVLVDADDTDGHGLELIRHLAGNPRRDLLVIARSRPDDDAVRDALSAGDDAPLRIPVGDLPAHAQATLVLDVTSLPEGCEGADEVARAICARTSGLPGPFLSSLQTLVATGGLVATERRPVLTTREIPGGTTDDSIREVLNTLDPGPRHALACLLAFGAPIGPSSREILGCDLESLKLLIRKGLARRMFHGGVACFEPTLRCAPEAVDAFLETPLRLRMVEAAEASPEEVGARAAEIAARHRLDASPDTEAVEAATRVAGVALAEARISTAKALYDSAARASAGSGAARGDAAVQLARVNACLGEADQARAAIELATDLADSASQRARVLSARGETERLLGSNAAASAAFDEALSNDELTGDERARALRIRAICRLQLGRAEDALDDAEAAIEHAKGSRETATCLGTRAQVLHRVGRSDDSLQAVDAAIAALGAGTDAAGTLPAGLRQLRGLIRAAQGAPARAIEDLEIAATVFDEAGHLVNLANTLNNLALLHERIGSLDRALTTHEQALSIRRRAHDPVGIATSRVNRGVLLTRTGRWTEARDELVYARDAFASLSHPRAECAALIGLAELDLKLGRLVAARAAVTDAAAVARAGDLEAETADARLTLAAVLSAAGAHDAVLETLGEDTPEHATVRHLALAAIAHAHTHDDAAATRNARAALETATTPDETLLALTALRAANATSAAHAEELVELLPALPCPADRVDAELLLARIAPERMDRHRLAGAIEHALQDLDPEEGRDMYTTRWHPEVEAVLDRLRDDGGALAGDSMEALQRITRTLASDHKPAEVLEQLLDACIELGEAEHGFIVLREGDEFECVTARQTGRRALEIPKRMLSSTIILDVLANGRPITTGNARDDSRFGSMLSVNNLKLTSVACLPFTADGRVRGAIYLDHPGREGLFPEARVRLLSAFADHAAMVFQRAEHEERIQELNDQLKVLLQHEKKRTRAVAAELKAVAGGDDGRIVAESPGMRDVLDLVERVAPTDIPVLIVGETGTGKDLVAREIHARSVRSEGTFLSENCAAIPAGLLEAELFGAARGAYTGAVNTRSGLMALASGGTLFLDEVGDMPEELQGKLLRALEEGSVRPLGSSERVATDFRLVTATNRPVEELRSGDRFRPDLFYRIGAAVITIPPLRDRPEDTAAFIDRYLAQRRDKNLVLEATARRRLLAYDWPGNFRELQNELARLTALADDASIGEALLSDRVRNHEASTESDIPYDLQDLRRWALLRALEAAGGNKEEAARLLGVSRSTLYQELKKHGFSGYLRSYNRRDSSP